MEYIQIILEILKRKFLKIKSLFKNSFAILKFNFKRLKNEFNFQNVVNLIFDDVLIILFLFILLVVLF